MAGRHQHERVAVRRSLGDGSRAERSARAAAIVDDDRLAQALLQPLADHAGDNVGTAAGGIRHDQPNGPGRKGLRCRDGGRSQHQRHAAKKRKERSSSRACHHRLVPTSFPSAAPRLFFRPER